MIIIKGYKRTPYIIIASLIGIISQILLSFSIESSYFICILMIGINISIAIPDVVIDATIASKSLENEKYASYLQTFCTGSVTFCSIIGYSTSGFVIKYIGIHSLFRLSSLISILVLICSIFGFIEEAPIPNAPLIKIDKQLFQANPRLFFVAILVSTIAVLLTILIIIYQNNIQLQFIIIGVFTILLIIITYFGLKSLSKPIANLGLLLFTMDATTPNLETSMFYWYTNASSGPKLSSSFIGVLNMIGYCGAFSGVLIFSNFLKYWKYKSLYIISQVSY